MQAWYLLLVASCALAAQDESRAKKQPIVVDAVGNTLPPPSNVPATVGSPINLLTPDRYEFYTFDESGELVKRLMTLEEIQAIVAAGEEAEGLVTLANDNQPTAAFNFSQPPYTVLHSVVTNVQNVLKEQMEAHKKDPMFQPTLDTPDVSDSWSLILPSIFGNTGLDIVPDRTSSGVTTPETETFDLDQSNSEAAEDNLSKEGSNQVISSSTTNFDGDLPPVTIQTPVKEVKTPAPTTTTTSTTTTRISTRKPTTTTTTTQKPTTAKLSTTSKPTTAKPTKATTVNDVPSSTKRPPVSATTSKPRTTTSTTIKPRITTTTTTTSKPRTTTTTTSKPRTTTTSTSKPRTTTTTTVRPRATSTTKKPIVVSSTTSQTTTTTLKPTTTTEKTVRITPKVTTSRPPTTKKQPSPTSTTPKTNEINLNNVEILTNIDTESSTTEKSSVHYEKVSTFIPISTVSYIKDKSTESTTKFPVKSTKPQPTTSTTKRTSTTTVNTPLSSELQPTITTYRPSTTNQNTYSSIAQSPDLEKNNATTITTQSVSPSTTATSTEFLSVDNSHLFNTEDKPGLEIFDNDNINEPIIPIFDVAQSISQIASDLGGNYMPLPTVSNMLDTTKINEMDLESKEDFEMDIPTGNEPDIKQTNVSDTSHNHFVKISTLDPHSDSDKEKITIETNNIKSVTQTTQKIEITTPVSEISTIDHILSESMGDLLSQVVNEAPQSIVESDKQTNDINGNKATTTEESIETTTKDEISHFTTTTENTSSVTTTTESPHSVKPDAIIKEWSENNIPAVENSVPENRTNENKISENKIAENYDGIKTNETEIASTTESQYLRVTDKSTTVEQNNNYVQISISNEEILKDKVPVDDVIAPFSYKTNESAISINQKETEKKGEQITDTNAIKVTTPSSDAESQVTTIAPIEATKKTEAHKQAVKIDINDKIPELLPKIDDFKKKIQKVNIDDVELANERNNSWKLISTVSPPKSNEIPKDKHKNGGLSSTDIGNKDIVLEFSNENQGLEVTTKDLEEDVAKFTELCNELAFRYWNAIVENIDKRRSFVLSPYSITSMLAMMFMGARGATSGEMNDILKLDDMVTFNPHFTLKNISDSIETSPKSGVIVSAFIRELYSDKSKGKILTFYKERAQQFYNGHVEEINFKLISDIIRRRTNLLVKRYTWGKIVEYMKSNLITMHQPLAAFSANIFQTDCTGSSVEGRDGEMYFVVSPNVRQRRLVPVPAVVYRSGFLAGYDPVLDATAAALGNTNSIISTLFVMPGQQGNVVHAEDLETLEQRLLDANPTTPAWNRLLRTLLPRIGLELQIPRFSHKSIFNVSSTLKKMGLKDLFDAEHADLGGLNGPSKDLYLSDMIQSTSFVTCGEGVIGEQHHVEEYPESLGVVARRRSSRWTSDWDEPRDYQRAFHDPHDVGEAMHLPLHLRPRQARLPSRNAQPARLKFDRPFLYFVRHNPSGMILYVGRYNPRLLP